MATLYTEQSKNVTKTWLLMSAFFVLVILLGWFFSFYYFCLFSEAFLQQGVKCRQIEEEDLDAFEGPFHEMLDQFFEEDDEAILEDFCDQPDLNQFIAIEISEEDEDGTSLDDDTATQLFIVATALITLLSRAIIQE